MGLANLYENLCPKVRLKNLQKLNVRRYNTMKIKIEHFKWFDNKPLITEFEGTKEEFEMLLTKGYVTPVKDDADYKFVKR